MRPVIEVEGVTYSYPRTEKPALADIHFTIFEGQFATLIGPSGAGKSTLCYALNGCVP